MGVNDPGVRVGWPFLAACRPLLPPCWPRTEVKGWARVQNL